MPENKSVEMPLSNLKGDKLKIPDSTIGTHKVMTGQEISETGV
jgi:hypothetical protein